MKILTLGGTALLLASSAAAQWTERSPATSPAGRGAHGMAYDTSTGSPTSGQVVLFGGDTFGFPSGASNETWRYDGSTWTQMTPVTSPPATVGAQLVYDANRGVFVTYGSLATGFFGGPSADRTWEFDGTTWTENTTLTATPGGLALYGMTYDSDRNVVVLYGGLQDSFFPINAADTWEYDGTNWNLIATTGSPGPLERPAMCYHDAANVTVMFGGIDVQIGGTDDVWLYDGAAGTWTTAAVTGPRPLVRTGCKMVYDSVREICVMTGGQDPSNGTPYNDTWEFDLANLSWTQVPSTYTDARLDAGLAFDVARRQVVQFGGYSFVTFQAYGDTWEYGARSRTYGAGCPGSNGTPALDAADAPRFGATYTLDLTNLNPAVNVGLIVLSTTETAPTPLDGIGLTGCNALVTPEVLVTVTGSAGAASYSATLPSTIGLMGVSVFSQGLSLDPMFNPAWLTVSNGHEGTLGN